MPLAHELAHMLVHLEELTDVVQAEVRAQQAEALARIGTLAANIAHEIRNPLAAISATLKVIGGSLATNDRRKVVLEKVGDQVLRLDRLVRDLLCYSRPAHVSNQVIHVRTLVMEAVAQSELSCGVRQAAKSSRIPNTPGRSSSMGAAPLIRQTFTMPSVAL
ncbi:MAG: signal transduction histidine kinase [Cognaticolwellia sp.]